MYCVKHTMEYCNIINLLHFSLSDKGPGSECQKHIVNGILELFRRDYFYAEKPQT